MRNQNVDILLTMMNRPRELTELLPTRKPRHTTSNSLMVMLMTLLMSLAGNPAMAADGAPMTPELAAKKEMVRKQEEQRITPDKRKAAAAALKAQRLKVHQARQAAQQAIPVNIDNK